MAEKTQQPTSKRLRDARKRGEVVLSSDVTSALVFIGVVVTLLLSGMQVLRLCGELWANATAIPVIAEAGGYVDRLVHHAGLVLLWAILPLMIVAAICGMAGAFVQVGGLMAWERIKPDVNRMNPAAGLKRLFSTNNLINLAKMIVKTLLLGGLMFVVIRGALDTALRAGKGDADGVLSISGALAMMVFGWAAVIYIIMASVDYVHVRYEFMKQNRMSIDDVRREHKDVEGDPVTQSRHRAARQEAIYAGLIDRVRAASVVVHSGLVAVAVQYLGETDLPRVIARGQGEVAAQIRRIASDALIPCQENANLAQRLYDDAKLDLPVPRFLYDQVAALLRWAQGRA